MKLYLTYFLNALLMHIPILNRPSCLLKWTPMEPQPNTIDQYNSISPFSFSINHVEIFYFYAFIHFSNRSYQCFSRRYANVIYCYSTYEATILRGFLGRDQYKFYVWANNNFHKQLDSLIWVLHSKTKYNPYKM